MGYRFNVDWNKYQTIDWEFGFQMPPSSEPLGEDGKISHNIGEGVHIVSLDDNRMWRGFTPTLMGKEDRMYEVWFHGEHGDKC